MIFVWLMSSHTRAIHSRRFAYKFFLNTIISLTSIIQQNWDVVKTATLITRPHDHDHNHNYCSVFFFVCLFVFLLLLSQTGKRWSDWLTRSPRECWSEGLNCFSNLLLYNLVVNIM